MRLEGQCYMRARRLQRNALMLWGRTTARRRAAGTLLQQHANLGLGDGTGAGDGDGLAGLGEGDAGLGEGDTGFGDGDCRAAAAAAVELTVTCNLPVGTWE
jgi:hypothetical protein